MVMNDTTSNDETIVVLINKIKEYFDFDEIILYNPDDPVNKMSYTTFHSAIVRSYVDDNVDLISNSLKTKRIDVRTMRHDNIYFILNIIHIENNSRVKFVIFSQINRDDALNAADLEILSNPIRMILSSMFQNRILIK